MQHPSFLNRRDFLGLFAATRGISGAAVQPAAKIQEPVVLLDDGGWCWFEDERAIVVEDNLIFGTVATGYKNPAIADHLLP